MGQLKKESPRTPCTNAAAALSLGPVIIVVGIKKEKGKNSQKGKIRRERKGFPEIYDVVL